MPLTREQAQTIVQNRRVHTYVAPADNPAWCWLCHTEITGLAVGCDHPHELGLDLHPWCADELTRQLRLYSIPGPDSEVKP
jgi:hypothetical protein